MIKRKMCENPELIKYGRIDDACRRYSLGRCTMRRLAGEAGAVVHVGKSCLINFARVDAYLEALSD